MISEVALWVDAVRVVSMALGLLSTGMALRIGLAYVPLIKRHPPPSANLLPIHVVLISVAWALLNLGFIYELYLRLGEPPTWRVFGGMVTAMVSGVALVSLSIHMRVFGKEPRRHIGDSDAEERRSVFGKFERKRHAAFNESEVGERAVFEADEAERRENGT